MKKINVLLIIIFVCFSHKATYSYENFIKYKINNEIITNFDLSKEEKYLLALNPKLSNLEKNQLRSLAKNSIINEKIKKIELDKFFELNKNKDDPVLKSIVEDLFDNIGIIDEKSIINHLSNYDLTFEWVREKIEIETLWNNLIFNRYKNQIVLDLDKLKKELKKDIKNKKGSKSYFLSEIFFNPTNEISLNEMKEQIKESIEKKGFSNTATVFSISDSAKTGGKIGWVDESSLSTIITDKIKNLKINEITNFIELSNGHIVLKIEDIKITKKKIDEKKALDNKIFFEKNKQLAQFSKILFNKIKQDTSIREY